MEAKGRLISFSTHSLRIARSALLAERIVPNEISPSAGENAGIRDDTIEVDPEKTEWKDQVIHSKTAL